MTNVFFLSKPWPVAMFIASWITQCIVPVSLAADPSGLCLQAAQDASRINSVPLSVLVAITQTETGREQGGTVQPWPWTVNIDGLGQWFDDQSAAIAFVGEQIESGARSFDIGCFQINYRWHGENFVSIEQMFDPLANATYAAEFLASLHGDTGDWSLAAGAYHSRTLEHAERYRVRFDQFRTLAVAAGVDIGASVQLVGAERSGAIGGLTRRNNFVLLQPGGPAGGMGSLVPSTGG